MVSARIAVISVAKINKYRAPSQKTLDAVIATSPVVYMTKNNGAVSVTSDGDKYEGKPYRPGS